MNLKNVQDNRTVYSLTSTILNLSSDSLNTLVSEQEVVRNSPSCNRQADGYALPEGVPHHGGRPNSFLASLS